MTPLLAPAQTPALTADSTPLPHICHIGACACMPNHLAGTPIQNDLSEFHAVFDCALPGLLGDLAAFKRDYELPIQRGRDSEATDAQVRHEGLGEGMRGWVRQGGAGARHGANNTQHSLLAVQTQLVLSGGMWCGVQHAAGMLQATVHNPACLRCRCQMPTQDAPLPALGPCRLRWVCSAWRG